MDPVSLDQLQEGDLCDFTYRLNKGPGYYVWHCTAVFLNRIKEQYRDEVAVSYRPLAGTSYIETASITNIVRIKTSTQRRGHGRGDEGVRLPYRIPGRVPPPEGAYV